MLIKQHNATAIVECNNTAFYPYIPNYFLLLIQFGCKMLSWSCCLQVEVRLSCLPRGTSKKLGQS